MLHAFFIPISRILHQVLTHFWSKRLRSRRRRGVLDQGLVVRHGSGWRREQCQSLAGHKGDTLRTSTSLQHVKSAMICHWNFIWPRKFTHGCHGVEKICSLSYTSVDAVLKNKHTQKKTQILDLGRGALLAKLGIIHASTR